MGDLKKSADTIFGANARLLLLADPGAPGDVFSAKTAVGLLRYRTESVVAVLASSDAGPDAEDLFGTGGGIPIVESVAAALALQPTTLVVGVATTGGLLPTDMRASVKSALAAGLDVVNGLHEQMSEDAEFRAAAERTGARIRDIRRSDRTFPVASGRAMQTTARRVLTVGSDGNVGKMVASLEITRALERRGSDARFVATGQTGMMISGGGVCVDGVLSDFIAGAAEQIVLEQADADVVVVEGQGSIVHPGFSGVTLGLMHGVLPDRMILVHRAGRRCFRRTNIPIPPLAELIILHEQVLAPLHPSRVTAVALNCHGMTDDQAKRAIKAVEDEVQLPTTDCLRFGADLLADACLGKLR